VCVRTKESISKVPLATLTQRIVPLLRSILHKCMDEGTLQMGVLELICALSVHVIFNDIEK